MLYGSDAGPVCGRDVGCQMEWNDVLLIAGKGGSRCVKVQRVVC